MYMFDECQYVVEASIGFVCDYHSYTYCFQSVSFCLALSLFVRLCLYRCFIVYDV
jgi:hypothetical protein